MVFLAIFQFSTYFPGYFDGQYWLWWVFLVLGECLVWEKMLKSSIRSVRILWAFLAVKYVYVGVQMECDPHTPLAEHIQVLRAHINTVLVLPVLGGSILIPSRSKEENNACNWCCVCSCILNGRVDCCLPHFIFFFLLWEWLDLAWSQKFCDCPRKVCFWSYPEWKDEVLLLPKIIPVISCCASQWWGSSVVVAGSSAALSHWRNICVNWTNMSLPCRFSAVSQRIY